MEVLPVTGAEPACSAAAEQLRPTDFQRGHLAWDQPGDWGWAAGREPFRRPENLKNNKPMNRLQTVPSVCWLSFCTFTDTLQPVSVDHWRSTCVVDMNLRPSYRGLRLWPRNQSDTENELNSGGRWRDCSLLSSGNGSDKGSGTYKTATF